MHFTHKDLLRIVVRKLVLCSVLREKRQLIDVGRAEGLRNEGDFCDLFW